MVDNLRATNGKIRHVTLEFREARGLLHGTRGKKDRSFLILDEDILRVAPVRSSMLEKARPCKFSGFNKGFLNSAAAKRGLCEREPLQAHPHWSSSSNAAPSTPPPATSKGAESSSSGAEGVRPGERTRVHPRVAR
ncbi:unnamed protein product [Prorocentrum cordatum]|uniref:Uncharacterized protein n=1 Tax=Prorocentrum cordatum TaxID=2364126 RepID=A0ABN9QHU3_9DINO|nr:unnamed protein product [Polarella glacialis]